MQDSDFIENDKKQRLIEIKKQNKLWIPKIGFFISFGIIIWGTVVGIQTSLFLKKARHSDVTVLKLIEKNTNSNIEYSPVFKLENVRGQVVIVEAAFSSTEPVATIGDTIEIVYDPKYPHEARLDSFLNLWGFAVFPVGSGILFFFVSMFLYIKIKLRIRKLRKAL